jgi:hypothetical protein
MLSSCQNMKIINNSFLNGLYNSEYSPVRVYDSYNISFQENHWGNNYLNIEFSQLLEIENSDFRGHGIRVWASSNLLVRNCSLLGTYSSISIQYCNNTLIECNELINNSTITSTYGCIRIISCSNTTIQDNHIEVLSNYILIESSSHGIYFTKNILVSSANYLLYLPKLAEILKSDFQFMNNQISGSFRQLSNRIGYIPNLIQLFSIHPTPNFLLLIFTGSITIFIIAGIIFINNRLLLSYFKTEIHEKLINTWDNGKRSSEELWSFTISICLYCIVLSAGLSLPSYFITSLTESIEPELPALLINYILMGTTWGFGLLILIIRSINSIRYVQKFRNPSKIKEKSRFPWKRILKLLLALFFSAVFTYLCFYLQYVLSRFITLLYCTLTILTVTLIFRDQLQLYGIRFIHVIVLLLIYLIDFCISTLFNIIWIHLYGTASFLIRQIYTLFILSYFSNKIAKFKENEIEAERKLNIDIEDEKK